MVVRKFSRVARDLFWWAIACEIAYVSLEPGTVPSFCFYVSHHTYIGKHESHSSQHSKRKTRGVP